MASHQDLVAEVGPNYSVMMWFITLFVSIVVTIGAYYLFSQESDNTQLYIEHAGELRVLSQTISKNASESASGKTEAFELLKTAREEFENRLNILKHGDPTKGLPGRQRLFEGRFTGMNQLWQRVQKNADKIIESKKTVLFMHQVASKLGEVIPQMQLEYDGIVEILLENKASADQILVAQRQSLLAERIIRSVQKILEGGDDSVVSADRFGRDVSLFERVLVSMMNGNLAMNISRVTNPDARDALMEIKELFLEVSNRVEEILETSPELFQVREAANSIFADSHELLAETSTLTESFRQSSEKREMYTMVFYICGIIAVLSLYLIAQSLFRHTKKQLSETAETNEKNQSAILLLLDELSGLADGDLTAKATVTEDFTGAIADSINYTIDQLRKLVSSINISAMQVSTGAHETKETAQNLTKAAQHQANEISKATAAINEMAISIDQVSSNAAESSSVAEKSVVIAKAGGDVVQNNIQGMDTIREQIQDTSKRIKRLGESSQEIGDIISLINDIADQTNILALNAAIQASMAGDAGKGFAVVADEVQRLAERAGMATKQVEVLVKTIQSDTNEAVISMEQTTSEVVRGARLAQDAGVALEEIDKVSKDLAELIQNISNAARQQSSSASEVSTTMSVIQEITEQTLSGINDTSSSIGNLSSLAVEMRTSVSGFKLPEDEISK